MHSIRRKAPPAPLSATARKHQIRWALTALHDSIQIAPARRPQSVLGVAYTSRIDVKCGVKEHAESAGTNRSKSQPRQSNRKITVDRMAVYPRTGATGSRHTKMHPLAAVVRRTTHPRRLARPGRRAVVWPPQCRMQLESADCQSPEPRASARADLVAHDPQRRTTAFFNCDSNHRCWRLDTYRGLTP